jgi:hypothetical protein
MKLLSAKVTGGTAGKALGVRSALQAPKRRGRCGMLATILVGLTLAPAAMSYDTGPHFDITRDALTSEGFSDTAVKIAQSTNWMIDFYENAKENPFSGHTGTFRIIVGGALFNREHWDDAVVQAADRSHFDQTEGGFATTEAVSAEWDRLQRNVGIIAREARDKNQPETLLAIIGMSLHQVQDFYSHTNWVEPTGTAVAGGPGWEAKGMGGTPTWFDIPKAVRDAEDIYSAGSFRRVRDHGSWKADGNITLGSSMAKDWPGRPLYTQAHTASYFASRQWVQGLKAYVADDAFWNRAIAFNNPPGSLKHDQSGATNISLASGHWQGQGEVCKPSLAFDCGKRSGPGGNLVDLRGAIKDYFSQQRSRYRLLFERLIVRMAAPNLVDPVFPVTSSQPMQRTTRLARLEITRVAQIDNLDVPGDADFFARAQIAGQPYLSAVIHNFDTFGFRAPNAPFTWLKALPNGATFDTPVATITVRLRTGTVRGSGTDDDVYLRINDAQRFALDKRLYDDFESGDFDTYSVPIDAAVERGLRVSDIKYLQIEKSKDGLAGAWRLTDAIVGVNGQIVANDRHIDRWLRGSTRTWRSTTFAPRGPAADAGAPVFIQLWELDAAIRGANDHTDTNGDDKRRDTVLNYVPGAPDQTGTIRGGSRFKGRQGDSDRATYNYRLSTYTPVPIPVVPPPPPPAQLPDLIVANFSIGTFTVTNSGLGPAGPFAVSVSNVGTFNYAGLAAGASITQPHAFSCPGIHAMVVDSTSLVVETDETNNSASFVPIC